MKKPLMLAAAVTLTAALTACGNDGGGKSGGGNAGAEGDTGKDVSAPSGASVSDYCDAYVRLFAEGDVDAPPGSQIRDWAADMEQVGTPGEMSDEARAGFEIFVSYAKQVGDNADLSDLEAPEVVKDREKEFGAFISYTSEQCSEQMSDLFSEMGAG